MQISRRDPYNRVWSTPMSKLARELDISDVGLAKACRRHNIPRPPRGYWAKLAAGKAPPKPALPSAKVDTVELDAVRHRIAETPKVEIDRASIKAAQAAKGGALVGVANFAFQTKDTNLKISDRLPQEYFPEFEASHPGALASQWIPMDPQLWKIENFRGFLEARKMLLAAEMNRLMEELLHGDLRWLEARAAVAPTAPTVLGGATSDEDEEQLEALNGWVEAQGLPRGVVSFDFADPETGEQRAVFDLAWPQGLQEELSQPVAVLLHEAPMVAVASQAGYRCFTAVADFKAYVRAEVLAEAGSS